ncbi:OmpA family protein [Sulfitobacter sp. JBTF-M27]|uniref:OmpA family protein n=1 Tax=Sulfitobacter sediminilitoris TaxID=2698830 RepID=A0A6P0CBR0_9RHOB|nr:OmpA family protein [Sulfitobacter sediminilitoris]NEK21923.1 OmpA family protein [Sulfitobacter sediminilitoris]
MNHLKKLHQRVAFGLFVALLAVLAFGQTAQAQLNPFSSGWTLQPEMSNLTFQSVKKQTVVESSSFATLEGEISPTGSTEVRVLLDSVDTKIDLRNVRMRFLFFETFKFPTATISTQIDAALLNDLSDVRRKTVPVTYTMDLHGVKNTYEAEVYVTLLTQDMVSVASRTPISVGVADFNLMEGLGKLQEAANVDIIPSATVSFDFIFARNSTTAAASAPTATTAPASVALEAEGNFDREACKGRFEILSRTGNIYFASGSSRHDAKSEPLLDSLANIISRCANMVIEVGGHTDSVGSDASNQRLSDARANTVRQYLMSKNLSPSVLVSKGYGESSPIATNDTREGRWKNRRIEFKVISN